MSRTPEAVLGCSCTSSRAAPPVQWWRADVPAARECARWRAQALDEIHAGIFDGMTYEQIEEQQPEEFRARKSDKLRYRCAPAPATPRPAAPVPCTRRRLARSTAAIHQSSAAITGPPTRALPPRALRWLSGSCSIFTGRGQSWMGWRPAAPANSACAGARRGAGTPAARAT